jgi:hypothetical protein
LLTVNAMQLDQLGQNTDKGILANAPATVPIVGDNWGEYSVPA